MFGALLRAAPQALFVALLAAVGSRVATPLIDSMTAGSAQQSDLIVGTLTAATDNFLLVGILALLITLVARATIEAQLGGV
jgi:hypothetical protein